jgi:hypothetical protein
MSYTIEVQPDQPVVIITYHGTAGVKELAESQQVMMAKGMEQFGPKTPRVFCILDIRDSQVSFVDGLTYFKEMMYIQRKNRLVGSVPVMLIFIGMNRVAKSFMQSVQMLPRGRFRASAVNDMDEAMALIKRMSATSE